MDYRASDPTITEHLVWFMRETIVPEDLRKEFGPDTPLLESGLVDSLNAARLLNFIVREMNVALPSSMIDVENFRDVRSISAMIESVRATGQHP